MPWNQRVCINKLWIVCHLRKNFDFFLAEQLLGHIRIPNIKLELAHHDAFHQVICRRCYRGGDGLVVTGPVSTKTKYIREYPVRLVTISLQ